MNTRTAILGGGCFWCVEHDLRALPGVLEVVSGYSGGHLENPTYEDVLTETTGHREVVEVTYDADLLSYRHLLQFFIDHIDPTDPTGQFADRGESYTPAIFYANAGEQAAAESVLEELDASGVYSSPSVVAVLPRAPFYPAEEYHQNYSQKNPGHYAAYRSGSGREGFVQKTCTIRQDKKITWRD